MKKNLICLGLVIVIAFAGVSFVFAGGKPDQSAESQQEQAAAKKEYYESKFFPALGKIPAPSKKYRIGCLVKTLINDFWMDFENGYKDANEVYDVVVDVYGAPSETDLLVQKQILDDMIAKNYDILLVSPLTDSNLLAALKTATDRGIPIINVCDAYISPEAQKKHGIEIECVIATDFRDNARLVTEYVAGILGEEGGQIMHIMGLPGGRAAEYRKQGYLEKVAEYPQLENIGVWPGEWERKKGMDIAADVIQSHPNLRAIIGANDNMALGAYQAVKNAGKTDQIYVAGIDAVPDAILSVMNGELICTLPFMQYQMAYGAIEVAIQILEGEFDPANKELYGYQEVWNQGNIREKVDEYREQFTGLKNIK